MWLRQLVGAKTALVALWLEVVLVRFCIVDRAKTAAIKGLSRLTFISLDPEHIAPLSQRQTRTTQANYQMSLVITTHHQHQDDAQLA